MAVEITENGQTVFVRSQKQAVMVGTPRESVDVQSVVVSGGGTRDYERLINKPQIEQVELVGNKDLDDFGMGIASNYDIAMLFA